jgi:hypothetical protein
MARAGLYYCGGGWGLPASAATENPGGLEVLPYLPHDWGATLPASEDVTAITDLLFEVPIIFWTPRDLRIAKTALG